MLTTTKGLEKVPEVSVINPDDIHTVELSVLAPPQASKPEPSDLTHRDAMAWLILHTPDEVITVAVEWVNNEALGVIVTPVVTTTRGLENDPDVKAT